MSENYEKSMRSCPRCGKQGAVSETECRFCGIVFAKYQNRRPNVAVSAPRPARLIDLNLFQLKRWGRFFGDLGELIGAGIPLQQAWTQHPPHAAVKRALVEPTTPHLAEGRPLSLALRHADVALPNYAWGHLEAGQLTGRMDTSLKRIAAVMERRYRASLAFFLNPATLYFLAILMFAGGSLGVMGAVTSQTSEVMEATKGQILLGIGMKAIPRIAAWWLLVATFIALFVMFRRRWEPTLMRRYPAWERLRLNHQFFGPMFRDPWLADYARQLAEFLDAGLPLGKALDIAAKGLPFPELANSLSGVRKDVERGLGLAESFAAVEGLPTEWMASVSVGARTGTLVDNLTQLADRLEEGAANRRRVWRTIALSGITLMGAIVVLLVLIFGLSSFLSWYEDILIRSF